MKKVKFKFIFSLMFSVAFCFFAALFAQDETVGKRPYEMVLAGREMNPFPALVDFEHLDGWSVETSNSEARFETSRDEQLWGSHVGRLTYRATGDKPIVLLKAPDPIGCNRRFAYAENTHVA